MGIVIYLLGVALASILLGIGTMNKTSVAGDKLLQIIIVLCSWAGVLGIILAKFLGEGD